VRQALPRALALLVALAAAAPTPVQFRDDFDAVATDPDAERGWAFFTGDGDATMDFRQGGEGYASIHVDARADSRNVWWALIHREVSRDMDLARLRRPGYEVRIEARIRVSHAPRRVNLQVLTRRTTDYHSHLMEYDIPDSETWHTISMTTRGFEAEADDALLGHLALMDWGRERYRVDLDYLKVDVVDTATAGPDQGAAVPYHPPVPDPAAFAQALRAAHDSMIDLEHTDANLNDWSVRAGTARTRLLTVDGTRYAILRWDLGRYTGREAAGHGLLELTTHSVERKSEETQDSGLVRVVELLDGDPRWDQRTVSAASLCGGLPLSRVLNPQMIIDWPVTEGEGARTLFTISRPVLQRMLDGRTLGFAIQPLGPIKAAFYAMEDGAGERAARLLFDLEPERAPDD
jgi:hypothetical protein